MSGLRQYSDQDDVVVKGDDGTDEGAKIGVYQDAAGVKRLQSYSSPKSTTTHFNGTTNTFGVNLPGSSANNVTTVIVRNPRSNDFGEVLSVSFDGGSNYFDLYRSESLVWTSSDDLAQINVKGSTASVDYQVIMNRESS